MSCLALLLPYNTAHRKLPDQSGNVQHRVLPQLPWFVSRLQNHELLALLSRDRHRSVFTELNERQTVYIVKLLPDKQYDGALTNWDKESRLLWEYLQYPADGFTVHVAGCCKFAKPVSVATAQQRVTHFVWAPDVPVSFEGAQVFCVPVASNSRIFDFAELPRILGVDDRQMQQFISEPLCVSVPCAIAELIGCGAWSKLMLRASWATRKATAMKRFMSFLGFPSGDWVAGLRDLGRLGGFAPPALLPLNAAHATKIAEALRCFAPVILGSLQDEEDRASQQFDLEQMVGRLDSFACGCKPRESGRLDATTAVATLAAAMQLRNRSSLSKTVKNVFEVVFPGCEVDPATWSKVPSASSLSRSQLLVDAAFCCFMRRRFSELHGSIFMLADSSPQAGHDYLLSTCLMISRADLARCSDAARFMQGSWDAFLSAYTQGDHERMREIAVQRQECGEVLKQCLAVHRFIPMGLGSGASSLDHKARAIARAVLSETQSAPALRAALGQVVSVTTDLGTEAGLADMCGLSLQEIVPSWVGSESELQFDCEAGDQAGVAMERQDGDFDEFFLPRAISIPGLNHIISNMCSDCNKTLEGWDSWLSDFREVVALLHYPHLRRRYVAACLKGTRHSWMEDFFKVGVEKFADWRWGSTVSVLEKLLPLRKYLQPTWDPVKFNAQEHVGADEAPGSVREEADVSALTAAIRSNKFWGFGSMIFLLNSVGTRFASWAEGCACHPFHRSKKQKDGVTSASDVEFDASVALDCCAKELGLPVNGDGKGFLPCPMAGLRAYDLASGAVEEQLSSMAALCKEELLLQVATISEEETGELLQDFERGKSHILATMTNKLQNWKMLPWRLAALSDSDESRARSTAASCLSDFDAADQDPVLHHRLTWYWMKKHPSFRAQLESFVAGEPLSSLPELQRTVSEMAFIPVARASNLA